MTPTAGDCRIKNLSLRASEDWREYLDRLARARRHPTWGALIDELVRAAGVDAGLGEPPPRAAAIGTNRYTAAGPKASAETPD